MKDNRIILGDVAPSSPLDWIEVNVSKLTEPLKGCIVADTLCGETVHGIIYGTFSIDFENSQLVFTAENEDVYRFDLSIEDVYSNEEEL